MERACRLERSGYLDKALDLVYDAVDQMLRASRFEQLDLIMANVEADDYSVDVLLGLLTATFPAKSRLPSRAKLFTTLQKVLRERGEDVDSLLLGLED